jgi:hypothetical protein
VVDPSPELVVNPRDSWDSEYLGSRKSLPYLHVKAEGSWVLWTPVQSWW